MHVFSPTLFIEINKSEYIFGVGDENEKENFKLIYKHIEPIKGIENFQIIDFELVFNIIKNNIYLIEQKLNFTFKDTVLIIKNFNYSFLNLSGFKKLNGSQILKENITYILNSLKSNIDEIEEKKNIIHIFNTKYCLDKKKINNLPIGLFGDFYSHELSFCLLRENDHKNLNNIFDKCNLRIRKIFLKSFIEGSYISNSNQNIDTFFKIELNEKNSQIFYYENDALKFEQNFNFGSDLIISDISKITSLKKNIVEKIIQNSTLTQDTPKDKLVEKSLFENINYRKINEKLIFQIAEARIKELSEILLTKNINISNYLKKNDTIFLNINNQAGLACFQDSYRLFFSKKDYFSVNFIDDISTEDAINNAYNLVSFGWKKEAIPVIHPKKSFIAWLFDKIFK